MLEDALALVERDPEQMQIATALSFREAYLCRGLTRYGWVPPKLEEGEEAPSLEQVVNSLVPDLRGPVRYAGMLDALSVGRGSALAAQTLLWDLLHSGDWAEPKVLNQLGIDADKPRDFLREVIMTHIKKDRTQATLWADALLFMHWYLYHDYWQSIMGLKEGDIPSTPYEALLIMFGKYIQIASPCLAAMQTVRKHGQLGWEYLVGKLEDWSELDRREAETRQAYGYFDPFHVLTANSDQAQCYLALRDVRRMLNLAHNKALTQREIYNKARGSDPWVTPIQLPGIVWMGLAPEQIAALRTVDFIRLLGDPESDMVEVAIRLEMLPSCTRCEMELVLDLGTRCNRMVCSNCHAVYEKYSPLAYTKHWYIDVADPESGMAGGWEEIEQPTDLSGGASTTFQVREIVVTTFEFLIEPAQFHQWREEHGIREVP